MAEHSVQVDLVDGSSIRWGDLNDREVDALLEILKSFLGREPDTIKA